MHATRTAVGPLPSVADALRRVEGVARRTGAVVQLVEADAVYNARHVASAAEHAERAVTEGRATARSLATEFLLYLQGERQVRRALELAGVRDGSSRLVLVAFGADAAAAVAQVARELGLTVGPEPSANPHALVRLGARDELALLERVALVDLLK